MISPSYVRTFGVPLIAGRSFDDHDNATGAPVVLINETMARRYWPAENPLGRRIKGFDARGHNDDWVTVIGVIKDVRSQGLERGPIAQIFESQLQSLDETDNLVVSGTAIGIPEALRRTIREIDRTAVLADVSTLDGRLRQQTAQRRFQTYLLTAFAALALLLAAAGVFATMHYWVAQRTQEIGIRMALGAERRTVLAMVLRETLVLAVAGVSVGVVGALAATRTITSILFGVTPHDPATFAAVSLGLTAIAMMACAIPAARAARVDPIIALKID
jgi:putative ABC transport system permease protein